MYFLKVIYHPLYSMKKFVRNKSKLPQDGAQVFPYKDIIIHIYYIVPYKDIIIHTI